MSILSKQLEELKWFRDILKNGGKVSSFYESQWQIVDNAIDTIEALSAKIQANNFNNGWIKFEKLKPEQYFGYKGKHVIDILVATDKGKVTKVQYIQYKNLDGKYEDRWHIGRIYGKAIAWQPLPEPYRE